MIQVRRHVPTGLRGKAWAHFLAHQSPGRRLGAGDFHDRDEEPTLSKDVPLRHIEGNDCSWVGKQGSVMVLLVLFVVGGLGLSGGEVQVGMRKLCWPSGC